MPGPLVTAEQLLHRPRGNGRCELVRGEVHAMSPAGFRHGAIAMRLGARLHDHAHRQDLGQVSGADTGFLLARDPDTVLAPDAAFVAKERLRPGDAVGFFPGAPDLAAEVRSPTDTRAALQRKARTWLDHGCRVVLTVDPAAATLTVWQADAEPRELTGDDVFHADDLLPGFRLRVADLFAD